jgi:hypothetical protein
MKHFDIIDFGTGRLGIFAEYSDDAYSKVKTECRFELKTAKKIKALANRNANEISRNEISNTILVKILFEAVKIVETGEHGNAGKKNALKDSDSKSLNFINMRCRIDDKKNWEKKANSENICLTKWIIKQLNQ